MVRDLKQLYDFRELLWAFTIRDIKVRYHQTVFGVLWAVIQPFAFMVVFTVIFTNFANLNTQGFPYPVFSYLGLVPWTLFSNSLNQAIPSIVNNASLVNKVYFPREVLPLSAFFSSFFDFLIATVILFILMLFFHVPLATTAPMALVFILALTFLSWGLSLLLSAVYVFFRDTRYILQLVIQLWLYVTPIIYPASLVPHRLQRWYFLNPLVPIMEGLRDTILYGQVPHPNVFLYPLLLGITLCLLGFVFFRRTEKHFADVI